MKSHIDILLKPFVQAVNQEINVTKRKYNTVKYYYSYGNEYTPYHEWNPGCLDELIKIRLKKMLESLVLILI